MLSELRAHIIADGTIAGLIGTRMYPDALPQAPTFPAVTYQEIDSVSIPTMRHGDNLPATRVQIDCWGQSKSSSQAVSDAIIALFHYYRRDAIDGVQGVFIANRQSIYEPDTKLYRRSLDFIIRHEEN